MNGFETLGKIFFMPFFFIFSIIIAFLLRKWVIRKILLGEFDESEKNLAPLDFFHNISEKAIKPFYYAALLFLIVDALFILIGVYIEYVKEMDFMEKYSDFPISPVLLILSPFMIPITLWCIVFSLFLIIFFIRKRENKKISEIFNKLNKKDLPITKEDFFNSDRIIKNGALMNGDIKLGNRFLFSIYPALIIPHSWVKDIKIDRISLRNGSIYSLNFIINRPFYSVRIFIDKEKSAEEIKNFILKK